MAIGDMAMMVIESDSGRAIEKTEALEIARMNQADGLVLQPSNTRKIDFVCACCGCCCGMLASQKRLPKPVEFWATNFYASVDADLCTACGTCFERCAVDAVTIDETRGLSVLNLDRCIGCGNCVVTCPTGAMALVKKDRKWSRPRTPRTSTRPSWRTRRERSARSNLRPGIRSRNEAVCDIGIDARARHLRRMGG